MTTTLRSLRSMSYSPYPVRNYFGTRGAFVSSAHFSSSCHRRQGCGKRVFFTPPAVSSAGALNRRPRSGLEPIAAIMILPARPLSSTTPLFDDDTVIVTKRCAEVWLLYCNWWFFTSSTQRCLESAKRTIRLSLLLAPQASGCISWQLYQRITVFQRTMKALRYVSLNSDSYCFKPNDRSSTRESRFPVKDRSVYPLELLA